MLTIKKYHMKLAVLTYSILLLISCGNTTKEKTQNTSQNKTAIIETEVKTNDSNTKIIDSSNLEEVTEVIEEAVEVEVEEVKEEIQETITNENISNPLKSNPEETKTEKKVQEEAAEVIEEVVEVEEVKEEMQETTEEIQEVETKTAPILSVSHKSWDKLLKKYVDQKGNVDYASFKNDETALQSYLDYLAKNKPANNSAKNERLAYYINLYHAATVKLILNNYPTKSIKSIKGPWSKKWVKVGDELLSLGYIEHKILRKMNEPRIHFAINCASYSCPKLVNSAFTVANMEQELEQATKDFVNDTTRNQFGEKAKLSEIFKWYKSDFTDNGTLLEYIAKYSNKNINIKSKIGYLDYDWSLNEAK